MISKRVGISPKNDNYARLADYIADAGNHSKQGGEKSLMHWCAGCLGDDDYHEGITEAVDIQALNTRSRKEKTYHLMISFRPEDEAKLTPEAFKAIEERFAAALGYSEHQRHCGVHKNTANLHMHIAYNMIHPEKHTRHKEFRDYWIRDKQCRELEKEYGLVVDNGRDKNRNKDAQPPLTEKAALIEAHTGQQSFESYAKAQRENILHVLETAADWQALHEGLALYGMAIKPHGSGLVVADHHNSRHTVRASTVDRAISFKKLEKKFGPYIPARSLENMPEQSRYQQAPLHRSPERGALFAEYQQGIEQRKTGLDAVKKREDAELTAIWEKWATKRSELNKLNIAKKNRRSLIQLARKHEAEEIARAKLPYQSSRNTIREEVPFSSWNGFLQHKVGQGNETALAILRSRQETVEPEQETHTPTVKDWSQHGREQFAVNRAEIRAEYARKERELQERQDISASGKKQLQSFLRMDAVMSEARAQGRELGEIKRRIDGKGVVIFTLSSGGGIRDTGREVFYSGHDSQAQEIAALYAARKWGKHLVLEPGRIVRREQPVERALDTERKKQQGFSH